MLDYIEKEFKNDPVLTFKEVYFNLLQTFKLDQGYIGIS